jgi:hypothetical protein
MACRGGNNHVSIGNVYEHDDTTCDEQLMTHLQRLKEQFDQIGDQFEQFGDRIGALTEQFAALGVLTCIAINQIHFS